MNPPLHIFLSKVNKTLEKGFFFLRHQSHVFRNVVFTSGPPIRDMFAVSQRISDFSTFCFHIFYLFSVFMMLTLPFEQKLF